MPEARLLLCSITMLLAGPQKLAVPQTNGVLVCSHQSLSQSSWQEGHCHVLSASLSSKVPGLVDYILLNTAFVITARDIMTDFSPRNLMALKGQVSSLSATSE